jgi:dUTP pyrophosphatase
VIYPGEIIRICTGVVLDLSDSPDDIDVQIRSRSGMAREGVMVLNSPGTIDKDYNGEIKVILANFGTDDFTIQEGDRIAQMVFGRVYKDVLFESVSDVKVTDRGRKGFGSTGR